MRVEDVVNVADQHELHIRGRPLGKRFDQPQQVLVRAQTADIEQKPAVRGDAESGQHGSPSRIARPRPEDRIGAFGDHADSLRSGSPDQAAMSRREASETVTMRSASRTAVVSLIRHASRPRRLGKTSSG